MKEKTNIHTIVHIHPNDLPPPSMAVHYDSTQSFIQPCIIYLPDTPQESLTLKTIIDLPAKHMKNEILTLS